MRIPLTEPATRGYVIAVLAVVVALLASRLLDIYLVSAPVSMFLCAIMLSAWMGGLGAGLASVALSLLFFVYYFAEPGHSLLMAADEIPRVAIFALSALF